MPPTIPKIIHADSTPNLQGPGRTHPQHAHTAAKLPIELAQTSSDEESDVDLLDYLTTVDDSYRHIKLHIPANHVPEAKKHYEKRVLFDTINVEYDSDDDSDDDSGRDRGRDRGRGFPSPLHSPSVSPMRMRSPGRGSLDTRSGDRRGSFDARGNFDLARASLDLSLNFDGVELSRILSNYNQPKYPTTPIITHRGCTMTKLHNQYKDLYAGKLFNHENKFLFPVLPHRVILVYITARKHTWVALDWVLNKFIQNGDSVIIVLAIGLKSMYRAKLFSTENLRLITPKQRIQARNRPEYVKNIAKNIMSYSMEVINPKVIAKVSIELAIGKSKRVLQEMYKLYEPNLVVTGAKPSVHISAPLRSWTSSKITDRLVKNFPLPVIIIPAVNMGPFEKTLAKEINSRYTPTTPLSERITATVTHKANSPDDASISSSDSYSSFEEISEQYQLYKSKLHTKLESCGDNGYTEQYFSDVLRVISDRSAEFCRELKSIDPDFRGRGAKLARAITGSNSFGTVPYKTKSMLAAVEPPPPEPAVDNTPKISYKEVKRRLRENQQAGAPQIVVSKEKSPSLSPMSLAAPPSSPPKQMLKFVNLEKPSERPKKLMDLKKLQKSFSHDGDTRPRPSLEPMKSHPDLHPAAKGDGKMEKELSKTKKKSSKFWKLFR